MKKTYVLDTNTLLVDSEAIFKFEDNHVVLPIVVLEELDRFKKEQSELGRNARQVARNLDSLRELGDLSNGVSLTNGGTIKVALALSRVLCRLPLGLDENTPDNQILAVAIECGGTLVTRDINLRIKASSVGVDAEDYKNTAIRVDEFYTGTGKVYVTSDTINELYKNKSLPVTILEANYDDTFHPNQCFTLLSMDNEKHSALARYDSVMKELVLVGDDMKTLGLEPKNAEQTHALNLLRNNDIKLVSMIGKAGSGKTLLALAAGIYGVTVTKEYTKVLLLKPIVSMDNKHQLGFLPGSMEEKLAPWLSSYYDNIEFIMGNSEYDEPPKIKNARNKKERQAAEVWNEKSVGKISKAEELISLGLLEIGSLEHIRGRSLPNQLIIIDEAQGLTQNAIKTIITRAGEGTKVILMGDVEQIDLPYLSADNNGLVYVADKFKQHKIAGHITLTKSVRSELAELAAELL